MSLTIVEHPLTRLAEYAEVPIGFTVAEILDSQARAALMHHARIEAVAISPTVGGATVIVDDPNIDLLRGCSACALLWDIRVAPDARRQGIGTALLDAVELCAGERGALSLHVETQDVNVPACRFYHAHGFRLERVVLGAYPNLPNEVQLLWRKPLR